MCVVRLSVNIALCNKFRPTYIVAVQVVAYIYAQLVQQVFVVSFCEWIKRFSAFHSKYFKSSRVENLYQKHDILVVVNPN